MGKIRTLEIYQDFGTFRQWEIFTYNSKREFGIVTHIEVNSHHMHKYHVQDIYLSKYWVIRKIQSWIINSVFKPTSTTMKFTNHPQEAS